jgi:hypothetical protein
LNRLELLLFSTDPVVIRDAVEGGAAGVIVDWERTGKSGRQAGRDTEINHLGLDELRTARSATSARLICRLNGFGPWTSGEVDAAIAGGADEVLLPMVRGEAEVRETLEMVNGRCGLGILVETVDAVSCVDVLGSMSLTRLYVGLNDLAIERGTSSLFAPLAEGLLDDIRGRVHVPFGFGGLTVPGSGSPLPSELLMAEMVRLDCQFTFLRRSFHADVAGGPVAPRLRDIMDMLATLQEAPAAELDTAHRSLAARILASAP